MKKCASLILLGLIFFGTSKLFADADDTVRNKIPSEYYYRCENQGKTELYKYKTAMQYKNAIVYTPYGYNPEDKETRYPVLYLMHGGGGTAESYIGPATSPNSLCWIIDNAIQNGEIEPLIIVCPNSQGSFHVELKNYLIPSIDENFNTKPSRENRAFGGFSMGSVITWAVFMHDLDVVQKFIPMSGDSWVYRNTGGNAFADQTAQLLTKADKIADYPDYKIFAATGSADIAYPNLTPQIEAMKKLPDFFKYTTEDFSEGNLIYYVVNGNAHSYNHTYEYIYNALKLFFPDTN